MCRLPSSIVACLEKMAASSVRCGLSGDEIIDFLVNSDDDATSGGDSEFSEPSVDDGSHSDSSSESGSRQERTGCATPKRPRLECFDILHMRKNL